MRNCTHWLAKWGLLCCAFRVLAAGTQSARAQETPPATKAPAPASPATPGAPPSGASANNVPGIVLPFEMKGKLIVLSLPLLQAGPGEQYRIPKSTRPLRLVLDSGADGSLLAEEAFTERKIALPPPKASDSPVKLHGIGNDKATSARILSDIEYAVGNTSLKDTPFLAPLGALRQIGVDGILGAGVFFACVVEVDYAHKIIRFFDPATYSPPTPDSGFTRVPLQRIAGTNRVTSPVDVTAFGFVKTTAQLAVDTGSMTSVYFTSPFVKRNKWETYAPRTIKMQSLGMGGMSNSRMGRLKEISFGGVALAVPLAEFSFDTNGGMTVTNIDGLIGGGILSRFTVIFDYSRASLYLRPTTDVHTPFVYQEFGFENASTPSANGGWLLTNVIANSAMAQAGVKKGEYLFAVDKKAIGKLTEDEFIRVLDGRTGERVFTVGDAKGEKKRDVRVTPIAL